MKAIVYNQDNVVCSVNNKSPCNISLEGTSHPYPIYDVDIYASGVGRSIVKSVFLLHMQLLQKRRNMSQPGGAENKMGNLGLQISSLISM